MANKEHYIQNLKIAHERVLFEKKVQKIKPNGRCRKHSNLPVLSLVPLPISAFEVLLKKSVIDQIRTSIEPKHIPSNYKGAVLKHALADKVAETYKSTLNVANKLDKKWNGPAKLKKIPSKYSDQLDALSNLHVPNYGPSDSSDGEVIRAMMKIGYRWYNDGDTILQHCDSLQRAANFLGLKYPKLKQFISKLRVKYSVANDKGNGEIRYQNALHALIDQVYLCVKDSKFESGNTEDYLRF